MPCLTRYAVLLTVSVSILLAGADNSQASDAPTELCYRAGGQSARFQDVPLRDGAAESLDRDRLLAAFDRPPDYLGWFDFGASDASPITVARFDHSDRSDLYVDLNRDQVLSENERASLIDAPVADARDRHGLAWTADVPVSSQETQDSPAHTLRFRVSRSTDGMLVAQAGHLSGQVDKAGHPTAAQLFDTNCNGTFSDSADRLHLDLDSDGHFSPLREKFACRSVIRIDGDRFTLAFSQDEHRVTLRPLSGTGSIIPTVQLQDSEAEITEFHALLVSDDGVHVTLNQLGSPSELPVGAYRMEQLRLKLQDDRVWAMNFSRSSSADAEKVRVTDGETSCFDVLGTLTLEATVDGGEAASGALTVQPSLTSSTGLYLTSSRVGKSKAQNDNQLTASLMRLTSDGEREPVSVSGTGFQCGTFCPIVFSDQSRIAQSSLVFVEFDSGPLAGPMVRVTVPPRLESTRTRNATEGETH